VDIEGLDADRLVVAAEGDAVLDFAIDAIEDFHNRGRIFGSDRLQHPIADEHLIQPSLSPIRSIRNLFGEHLAENVSQRFLAGPAFRITRLSVLPSEGRDLGGISSRFTFSHDDLLDSPID
jgi:hypothetical protein